MKEKILPFFKKYFYIPATDKRDKKLLLLYREKLEPFSGVFNPQEQMFAIIYYYSNNLRIIF